MESLKSVFSDFRVGVEKEAVLKIMGASPDSARYAELGKIYDEICDGAMKTIKPGVAFVIRDSAIFGLEEELKDCANAIVCFCTVGGEISLSAEEQKALGFNDEADVLDAIGDICLLRTRATAFGYVSHAAARQFLGMKKPMSPGDDINRVFNSMIVMETGADKLFGAKVSFEDNEITPAKSTAFICGCDSSLPLPFDSFTPPDCNSCLRRDCAYCEFGGPAF